MGGLTGVELRPARRDDAAAIAALHADSWRRHYRGAYSDLYLDGDVAPERLRTWTARLESRDADAFTLVAEHDGALAGFVHVRLGAEREWGALVDNLHVADGLRGLGLGTRLLAAAGRELREREFAGGVHLWVQEQNTAAQAFYRARGGRIAGRVPIPPPQGDPRNLNGAPWMLRVVWPDASALIGTPAA